MRAWRCALLLILIVAALPPTPLAAQNPPPLSATPTIANGAAVVGGPSVKVSFSAVSGTPTQVRWRWGAPPTDTANDSGGWAPYAGELNVVIPSALLASSLCSPVALYTQVRSASDIEPSAKSDSVIIDGLVQAEVRATNPYSAERSPVLNALGLADLGSDGASDGDPGYTRAPQFYLAINGAEDCAGLASFQFGRNEQTLQPTPPTTIDNNAFFNVLNLRNGFIPGTNSFLVRVRDKVGNTRDVSQQLIYDTDPPILDPLAPAALTAENVRASGLVDLSFTNLQVSDNLYPGGFWGIWLAVSRDPLSGPTADPNLTWTTVEVPAGERGGDFTLRDWDFMAGLAQPTIGTYYLYARALDGAGNPSQAWLATDLLVTSVSRPATYTVSGTVTRSDGTPLPAVTVALNRPGLTALTDLSGRYRIGGVPRGVYIASAYRDGYRFDVGPEIDLTGDRALNFVGQREATAGPVSVPARPGQSYRVGNLTVYADSFSGSADDWTARGTIWLGDYTIVDGGTLHLSGSTLSGSGTVSMITSADRKQRTILFADTIAVADGILTPELSTGFRLRLGNLGGFKLNQQLVGAEIDLIQGIFSTAANLSIAFPGNELIKQFRIALDFRGKLNGAVSTAFSLSLGYASLEVSDATLATNGIRLGKTTLHLPDVLGGASADLSLTDARITPDGRFTLAEGKAEVEFPELTIGGEDGFGLSEAKATLTILNADTAAPEFVFNGQATFKLPGLVPPSTIRDPGLKGGCKIATEFEFSTRPPPFRKARIELKDGCIKIPIGQTGFVLTSVSGEVNLKPEGIVRIELGVGIESVAEFLDEALVSSDPTAFWDNTWEIGLRGKVKIFGFEIADAVASLSAARGYEGIITLDMLGSVITGTGHIHIWQDRSGFHITGRQAVQIQVTRGRIFDGCDQFTIIGCVRVPYDDITYGSETDIGEFRVGNERLYGLKGVITATIPPFGTYYPAYFVPAGLTIDASKIRFDLGGLKEYQLVTPALTLQDGTQVREATVTANTAALVAGVAYSGAAAPTIVLRAPNAAEYRADSPGVTVVANPGQLLFGVASPMPGTWQIRVEQLPAGPAQIVVLGGARPAAITALSVSPNGDGSFSITMAAASSTPTSTVSLFYDAAPDTFAGRPITQGLALGTTSFRWSPAGVPAGSYYLYAMVDDPLGAAAYRATAAPITISDATPPAAPTGLRVLPGAASAALSWRAPADADVAGYRVYYRDPRYGKTFAASVPSAGQLDLILRDLRLNGAWAFSISAYDTSGNESARSPAVNATVWLYRVQLPLLRR